jgi:hypothetical protein
MSDEVSESTNSRVRPPRDPRDAATEISQIQGPLVRDQNGSFQDAILDQVRIRIPDRASGPSRRDHHLDSPFATDLPLLISSLGPVRRP